MIRYAITAGAVHELTRGRLLANAQRWAEDRIDFIQIREKHLSDGELLTLAQDMLQLLKSRVEWGATTRTRLLVNGRPDIAIAARADGVHLTSGPGELNPAQVRLLFAGAGLPPPVVSTSCHSLGQVQRARDAGADLILFGPVFEKRVDGGLVRGGEGVATLEQACRIAHGAPVLALGGVNHENTAACVSAGAAGIAAIRLFAEEASRVPPQVLD